MFFILDRLIKLYFNTILQFLNMLYFDCQEIDEKNYMICNQLLAINQQQNKNLIIDQSMKLTLKYS